MKNISKILISIMLMLCLLLTISCTESSINIQSNNKIENTFELPDTNVEQVSSIEDTANYANGIFELSKVIEGTEEEKKERITEIANKKYSLEKKGEKYGSTPATWVFVSSNKQIVSNFKKNSSEFFGIEKNASSGSQGCFLPILQNTEFYSDDFEGRFFCFDDTTKDIEKLAFTNKISDLTYDGMNVLDILKKQFEVDITDNGLIKIDDSYVNIIYITDLDEILKRQR